MTKSSQLCTEDVQKAAAQGNERQKLQVEIEIRSMKLLDLQRQIRGKLDRTNAATAPTSNQRLRRVGSEKLPILRLLRGILYAGH